MSIAAESTVVFDSGWVSDGHHIVWNGNWATISHTDFCPYYMEGKQKVHLCSPALQTAGGISLDELPADHAAACRAVSAHGAEPVRWRLTEYLHPDLKVEEQNSLSIFALELDHDES